MTLNRDPARLFVHVGLPKTGTTTVQWSLFASHPRIDYFAVRTNGGDGPAQDAFERFDEALTRHDALTFDPGAHARVLGALHASIADDRSRTVISSERLTGRLGPGIGLKASRLHEVLGAATVLMTIRRPDEWLVSSYYQQVRNADTRYGSPPVPGINRWVEEANRHSEYSASPFVALRFHRLAEHYAGLFGRDNVHVLLFEDIRDDPRSFVEALAGILYLDPQEAHRVFADRGEWRNRRRTPAELRMERMKRHPVLSRMPYRLLRGLGRVSVAVRPDPRTRERLSEASRRTILEFARPECRALARDWGIDLARHGYPL